MIQLSRYVFSVGVCLGKSLAHDPGNRLLEIAAERGRTALTKTILLILSKKEFRQDEHD